MKKFLLTVLAFLLLLPAIAAQRPRWVGHPIYFYIPDYGQRRD